MYNRSNIFKMAWRFVKRSGLTLSEGLKKAWRLVKDDFVSTKYKIIATMEYLVALTADRYNYKISAKDWKNYGRSRTYFRIYETHPFSKHLVEYDFGYFDNQENIYVAGRRDITENYTLSGSTYEI